jgi:ATP-binding cassette subfamily B protein
LASQYNVFSTQYEESRKRKSSDRVIVRKVYRYAKDYRRNLAIGIAAIVLSSLTGLASPYLHKIAIDQIILAMNLSGFIWWVPIFVVITLANYALQYVQVYQMRIVGENVVAKMRDDMMAKQQVISLRYFSEGETGRIMSRLINDANTVPHIHTTRTHTDTG